MQKKTKNHNVNKSELHVAKRRKKQPPRRACVHKNHHAEKHREMQPHISDGFKLAPQNTSWTGTRVWSILTLQGAIPFATSFHSPPHALLLGIVESIGGGLPPIEDREDEEPVQRSRVWRRRTAGAVSTQSRGVSSGEHGATVVLEHPRSEAGGGPAPLEVVRASRLRRRRALLKMQRQRAGGGRAAE